ncbi:PIN domain nuclease [bacterium]|nr:MAG: PIN domain nuclease [bacterium]
MPAPGSAARTVTTGVFALVGAILLGVAASEILRRIFNLISEHILKSTATASYPATPLSIAPFALLGLLLGGFLGNRVMNVAERWGTKWDKMEAGEKANVFLGVFAGFVVSAPFIVLFQALRLPAAPFAVLIVASVLGLASLTVYVLQSMREVLPWTQGKGPRKRSGIKIFDTNVLIDGRILDVAKAGFLDGEVYVPGFVLDELQKIADNSDPLRRARGRRGLDVLKQLQAEYPLEARIHDRYAPEQGDDVDHRLVRLAKALGADIVTNDFNLRGVAEIQEVRVMSLNDLALALRPNVLPSEVLPGLKIIKEGREYGQGVGYLDDGTMVVVENGGPHLNETVDVTVTQVIQTERGKMIFAEIEGEELPGGTRGPRRGGPRRV